MKKLTFFNTTIEFYH